MISVKLNLFSNVLSMPNDVRILFPDRKEGNEEKVKVLWLCHGGSGDENEWMYYSTVSAVVDERNIAAVIVNANDSCVVNMGYGLCYADYLGKELPQILYTMFPRLSEKREDNFISGLSNGGYGCLILGLSNPDRYGAIGAFSAGDKADAVYTKQEGDKMSVRVRLFGREDIKDSPYSIRYLAEEVSRNCPEKPRVYHACGSKDPWLDLNLLVKKTFEELNDPKYDYRYDQVEGLGHEWGFWDLELRRFLDYALRDAAEV